jgi:hypothetical protein
MIWYSTIFSMGWSCLMHCHLRGLTQRYSYTLKAQLSWLPFSAETCTTTGQTRFQKEFRKLEVSAFKHWCLESKEKPFCPVGRMGTCGDFSVSPWPFLGRPNVSPPA